MRLPLFLAASIVAAANTDVSVRASSEDSDQLVVRVYDVSDLVTIPALQPFTGGLPASSADQQSSNGGQPSGQFGGSFPAGMGGGRGGFSSGMGGGGGQGFYSIPTQFGGGGGGPAHANSADLSHQLDYRDLILLLTTHVDPSSWTYNGGAAHCTGMNSALIVTQSAKNHERIQGLLDALRKIRPDSQTVRLHFWWLPIAAEHNDQLQAALQTEDPVRQITKLCHDVEGQLTSLSVPMDGTSHVASGTRVPVVTGQVPVVSGSGAAVAYQPIVTQMNIGLFAEASPRSTTLQDGSRGLAIRLRSAITALNEAGAKSGNSYEAIDRYAVDADVVETTVTCRPGQAVVVGRMTSTNHEQPLTLVVYTDLR